MNGVKTTQMAEFSLLGQLPRDRLNCADQGIQWSFAPEHAPHLGGLLEAAVKSLKCHFWCIIGDIRLMIEELAMILAQVEACLDSRTLKPFPQPEDGIDVLTPGYFLIRRPLEAVRTRLGLRMN